MVMKNILLTISFSFSLCFSQSKLNVTSITEKSDANNSLDQNMSINMENSDIKNVLMLIGELTGLNMLFISPAVKDTITASLIDVTVKAALDAILKQIAIAAFYGKCWR